MLYALVQDILRLVSLISLTIAFHMIWDYFPILTLCFVCRAAWMSSTSRTGMQRGWIVCTHCWSTLNASFMWMIWWKLPMMLSSSWTRTGHSRYLARFIYSETVQYTYHHGSKTPQDHDKNCNDHAPYIQLCYFPALLRLGLLILDATIWPSSFSTSTYISLN